MKLKFLIPSLLALGVTAAVSAQEVKFPGAATTPAAAAPAANATPTPAAAPVAAAPAQTFAEPEVLETIGWVMGKNTQADTFEFSKDQIDSVVRGFTLALEGKPTPHELKQIGAQVQSFVTAKQEKYISRLKQQGMKETAEFMAKVKAQPGVQQAGDGLAYEILKQGEGPGPKATDTVKAHYRGYLTNGTEFDNSYQRGTPEEFPLDQVLPAWTEGLQKIGKGGKIKLYVPPHLAYGDEGRPGIPPASTLVFEIELIDFKPTPVGANAPAEVPPAAAPTK